MISSSRVASQYLQANDPCRQYGTSAAWVSPDGEAHYLSDQEVHDEWAEDWLFAQGIAGSGGYLLKHGWVRVSNYLTIEIGPHLPSEKAMQATVDIILGCAQKRKVNPEEEMFLAMGATLKTPTLAAFVLEWGGKQAEERLFERVQR